jgi:beta-ribofuranosylaminobenzene 5'-phosphate synthase
MICVTAPSRLHFGLFALPARGVTHWPNAEGQPTISARHFGGVGLMIDQPGVQVAIHPASAWSATGPSAQRALAFGQRFVAALPEQGRLCFRIIVERCAPEHVGLGTGTQLALAVARAIALATTYRDWDAIKLARRVGRGLRSGLGIHGFDQGGLLVEGGKAGESDIAPLIIRQPFPDDWQVLLIVPRGQQGTYGAEERDAFAHLAQRDGDLCRTETLSRLALLGMLPALADQDLPAFGEALYEYNRRAGEWFLPWQGGVYASSMIEERIAQLRGHGVLGVGQSSWGPTIYAIERFDVLQRFRQRLLDRGELNENELFLCRAANRGAECAEE